MSIGITVSHGPFGRAAIYHLDRPLLTHVHRESQLLFFLHGSSSSQTRVDESDMRISQEHAIAINPWQPHSFTPCPSGRYTAILLLYIDRKWLADNTANVTADFQFPLTSLSMTPSSLKILNQLVTDLFNGVPLSNQIIDLVSDLTSENQSVSSSSDSNYVRLLDSIYAPEHSDFRVRKSIMLMSESAASAVQLDSIAAQVGLSRAHFFKLFKEQTGITPSLYINTLRAERAVELLSTTDQTVSQIGNLLGYASPASFSRFFNSNVGIPPTAYRQQVRATLGQ